ncbi:hypothetical protein CQY20_33720 [Mycolicibacterium agri]|uniref:Uncharacterized protein n=1 Tax=Mycolicibacterium agri TaxID=36811 RepID=A0A2A7MMY9_MYCAG|nr:hypothetical protein CQY20_33720 [Mycolicibacterium agri]GFG50123.1 hypothetical protein MAGR_15640 [Mycolicibacterium agri]
MLGIPNRWASARGFASQPFFIAAEFPIATYPTTNFTDIDSIESENGSICTSHDYSAITGRLRALEL